MNVSKRRATWHGFAAVALENGSLRVVMVPELGGKIASIYDCVTGFEWMAGPGNRSVRPATLGAAYTEYDMSGWDEMFPTISSCVYPEPGPYTGQALPDHGEAWSLPWAFGEGVAEGLEEGPEDEVSLTVAGRVLPYRLTRRLRLGRERKMTIEYTLVNLGEEAFAYLWTPHPQFACGEGGRLVLPPEVDEVHNVLPESWGWGEPGARHGWPEEAGPDGQRVELNRVRGVDTCAGRKYYLAPDRRVDWCRVERAGGEGSLTMRWDPAEVPYLGLWIDEGAFNGEPAVTPEPATGYYDSLELACRSGEVGAHPGRRN